METQGFRMYMVSLIRSIAIAMRLRNKTIERASHKWLLVHLLEVSTTGQMEVV